MAGRYAYLDDRRFDGRHYAKPGEATQKACPSLNQWGWGFGGNLPPYVAAAAGSAVALQGVRDAFFYRNVTYLLGGNDTCTNVTVLKGCPGHGLETTCADQLQGDSRNARGHAYYGSLSTVFGRRPRHQQLHEVPGVGHDHTLMFQSPVGIRAIFGAGAVPSPPSPSPGPGPSPAPPPATSTMMDVWLAGAGGISILLLGGIMVCALGKKNSIEASQLTASEEYSGF